MTDDDISKLDFEVDEARIEFEAMIDHHMAMLDDIDRKYLERNRRSELWYRVRTYSVVAVLVSFYGTADIVKVQLGQNSISMWIWFGLYCVVGALIVFACRRLSRQRQLRDVEDTLAQRARRVALLRRGLPEGGDPDAVE